MAAAAANVLHTIPDTLLGILKNTPHTISKSTIKKNSTSYTNNTVLGISTQRIVKNVGFNTIKKPRAVFETTGPGIQCFRALQKDKDAVYGTPCNVCSLLMSVKPGFTPECDHILPIAQAVGLTGLEQSNRVSRSSINIKTIDEPTLKYQWIHLICNRIKLDWVFIMIGKDNKYIPDVTKLKNNLWNLWHNRYITDQYEYSYEMNPNTQQFQRGPMHNGQTNFTNALWTHYKTEFKSTYGREGTFEEVRDFFIETRCKAIIEQTYQPLCDKLNEHGNPQMNTLSAAIRMRHGPKHTSVQTPVLGKRKTPLPPLTPGSMFAATSLARMLHGPREKKSKIGGTRRTRRRH
jgi:predicted nucleic acid-binding Zn finger protein